MAIAPTDNDARQASDMSGTSVLPRDDTPAAATKSSTTYTSQGRHADAHGRLAIAGILIGLLAIAAITYMLMNTMLLNRQTTSFVQKAETARTQIGRILKRTSDFDSLDASSLLTDDGSDGSELIDRYVAAADKAYATTIAALPSTDKVMPLDVQKARQERDAAEQAATTCTDAANELKDAVNAIDIAKQARANQDAKDALAAACDKADTLLSDTEGKVTDDATREALSKTISSARMLADNSTLLAASYYTRAQGKLNEASDKVTASHDAWESEEHAKKIAEEARVEAERAAQAATNSSTVTANGSSGTAATDANTTGTAASDTWYVTYRGNDDDSQANMDGSVSEYRPNYSIAHRWSENGKRIASQPSHVVIDGRSYHYVSCIVCPVTTSLSYTYDFVTQNGGIGLSTCTLTPGTIIVNRYDPD